MKLVVFCLFAAWCISLASASRNHKDKTLQKRKLLEVLKELKSVNSSLQQSDKMLNTPLDIEERCCSSALQCFRANLNVLFNNMDKKQRKLYNSLTSNITERALCNSSHSENVQSTCPDCISHPKKNAVEFFNRLNSLIQKGITRLNMN